MTVPQKFVIGRRYAGLPVDTLNWMVDSIQKLQADQTPSPPPPQPGGPAVDGALHPLLENNCGEDLGMFGIVSLGDARLDVAGDEATRLGPIVLKAEKADPDKTLAILQSPLADEKISAVPPVLVGLSVVKLDVQSEADETAQVVKDDQAKLKTGGGSIPIVWKESGTGEKWGIVMLGSGGGGSNVPMILITAECAPALPPTAEHEQPSYTPAAGKLVKPGPEAELWLRESNSLGVINFSFSGVRPGVYFPAHTDTVIVSGEPETVYVLHNWDMSSLRGHVKGADSLDDAQAPYHKGDSDEYEIGRGDCDEEPLP